MNTQSSVNTRIKVGIIGFGRMGRFYWEAMTKSDRWNIAYICDTNPGSVRKPCGYVKFTLSVCII